MKRPSIAFHIGRGRMLLPLCTLALSCVLLCGAAVAWVTVNHRIRANGVEMTAETSANLVIAKTSTSVQKKTILGTGNPFSVTFTGNTGTYLPAEHNAAVAVMNIGKQPDIYSNLRSITGGRNVDVYTGRVKAGKTLTYTDVAYDDTHYYCDYIVYIAAAGQAMTGQTLTVTVSATDALPLSDTAMALSIDFYVKPTAGGMYSFRGTLNLAGYDRTKANAYEVPLQELTLLSGANVPLNTAGYITVLMRVYYDGSLPKNSTAALINSATVDTEPTAFTVKFTVPD